MAGGGAPTPSKGGKKSVDFIVNLIPTIDLLSVLISFLLITAVWTQLARIDTDQAISQNSNAAPQDPRDRPKNVNILITADEAVMNVTGERPPTRIARNPEEKFVKEMRSTLKSMKERVVDIPKVMLAGEDKVVYKSVINVMDICLDVGLSGITVANPTTVQGELL